MVELSTTIGGFCYATRISAHTRLRKRNIRTTITRAKESNSTKRLFYFVSISLGLLQFLQAKASFLFYIHVEFFSHHIKNFFCISFVYHKHSTVDQRENRKTQDIRIFRFQTFLLTVKRKRINNTVVNFSSRFKIMSEGKRKISVCYSEAQICNRYFYNERSVIIFVNRKNFFGKKFPL